MGMQLVLIDDIEPEWRLDNHTVEIGRRGVANARAVLAAARHLDVDLDGHGHHSASKHAA